MAQNNDPGLLNDTIMLLKRDLHLDNDENNTPMLSPITPQTYDALRRWLADIVADWLNNRPDYLRLALYRLDVSEKKARQAAALPDVAFRLADLIIEREWQKAQTRAQYRAWCEQNPTPDNKHNNQQQNKDSNNNNEDNSSIDIEDDMLL